ncbi:MAG: hypothetical protein EXR77_06775 [Myxococcales bacterium]|nr:hypothetical protein [Myxococcales bacterium]
MTLLGPTTAWPFSTEVHRWLTEKALTSVVAPGQVLTPSEAQFVAFYRWLGGVFAHKTEEVNRDGPDPDRFLKRFASPAAFDAFAIRGFLGLSQEQTPAVWGLEEFERDTGVDRFNLVVGGSAMPDVDKRNQNRFAYDEKRNRINTKDGSPLPADPMILNMGGKAEGLSSQAHAHYQLSADKPSDNPELLKSEPWNFVVATAFAGPVETYAAQMAQIHLDMAILAKAWGDYEQNQAGEYLSLMWWSAGLHYVQDAAGPLHNVQVGGYPVFFEAKLQWYLAGLLTAGGFVGPLPTFVAQARHLIRNLHLFAEQWLARELDHLRMGKPAAAALAQAWTQTSVDEPELMAALGSSMAPHLAGAFQGQPFEQGGAEILVLALAKTGRTAGAPLYEAALQTMHPKWRRLAHRLGDEQTITDAEVADSDEVEVAEALGRMALIHAKSVRRASTAARIYWQAFQKGSPDAAARRLRRIALNAMDAREKRLATYLKWQYSPPKDTEVVPEFLFAEMGAGVLLVGAVWLVRRWRRRPRMAKPQES